MLPSDYVSMSVGHLDHVLIVYSLITQVTHFQLCEVRSFYVIDRTN